MARLEARAAEGRLERDTLLLLAAGRLALGVSLGTVLPEERLAAAAAWTGKALILARYTADQPFLAHTLRMHGNELRKAGRLPAAVTRLDHALAVTADPAGQGSALALLARAAGEAGLPDQFDRCCRLLDSGHAGRCWTRTAGSGRAGWRGRAVAPTPARRAPGRPAGC